MMLIRFLSPLALRWETVHDSGVWIKGSYGSSSSRWVW